MWPHKSLSIRRIKGDECINYQFLCLIPQVFSIRSVNLSKSSKWFRIREVMGNNSKKLSQNMINRKDSPIKLTPPISGTFWLNMEALGLNLRTEGGLKKNSLIWKTENQKKEESHWKNHVFTRHRGGYQLTVIFSRTNLLQIFVYVYHLFHIP